MPLVTQWADCSEEGAVCEVNQISVVRFGAGVSFKFQLLDVDDATGLGNITCSTSEFGLGSPGRRSCQSAIVGVPARIAGPDPSFADKVELYVKPRASKEMACQLCAGCIDADGRTVQRNLAHGSFAVSWVDGSASGPAIQGEISTTVDGRTVNDGIVGGNNLASTCSIASGDAALSWQADLGSSQSIETVRIWSSVSAHAEVAYSAGYTGVSVWVSGSADRTAGVQCDTVSTLHPGSHVDVACAATGRYVFVASAGGSLGLCEVEVLGGAAACPDFCVPDHADYPAPISAAHQLVTWTDGLVQDAACDPETMECDGDIEYLRAELPAEAPLRLGGTRYQALFVAPTAGVYTFRARFDDVGELWLSRDADPRHTELMIESSSATTDGWFGPQHDPHQAHIALEVLSRFAGPLYITLLGSAARTEEMLLVRGSAGFELPVAGDCQPGEALAEYYQQASLNSAPVASQCERVTSGRKGYIIDKYTRDNNLAQAAADAGITGAYAIRYTTTAYFPADGKYTLTSKAQNHAYVRISGDSVMNNWVSHAHHSRSSTVWPPTLSVVS